MRWWLQTDPPCVMSVDNASVMGMDFSELVIADPDLWMVHWTEGKGEIERQEVIDGTGDGDRNLNGLREDFYDLTPYVPLFQQFLERMQAKNLLLDQAKKIQIDLIKQLFESKRQMPFHYTIAAGDYWWDATDGSLYASTAGGLQNATVKVNEVISRLNSLVASINSVIVGDSNTNVNTINSGIAGVGNTFIGQVNSIVVANVNSVIADGINTDFSNLAAEIYNGIIYQGNLTIDHINGPIIDTINSSLAKTFFSALDPGLYAAAPGISPGIAHNTYAFAPVSTYSVGHISTISPGSFSNIAYVNQLPWTNIGNVTPANAQWIPLGSSTPVPVTPDEQTAILTGIADRTAELFTIKNQKIGEVNALTTVADVIAYDVLADWPAQDAPPGFMLEAPVLPPSGGVSIIGTPAAPSAGVPEAPSDGVTYGRRNMVWNPALALSGDVLDGGQF
jgi:hypothetical protein